MWVLRQFIVSRPLIFVALAYVILAFGAGSSGLLSGHALGGETMLDHDSFFMLDQGLPLPPKPTEIDPTPACIDYPCALAFAKGLHAGRWDTWTNLMGAGVPLGVEQCGTFFPLKWIYYLWPSPWTYDLFRVMRLALAAVGMYLLARARPLPMGPAFVAGALFELSGALSAQITFGNASAPYMLPWMFLAANRLVHAPGPRVAAGAAVAIGVTGLAGHPTMIIYTWATFAFVWVAELTNVWGDQRKLKKILGYTIVAGLLGLAIAAPWMFPFAEYMEAGATYKRGPEGAVIRSNFLKLNYDLFPAVLLGPWSILNGPYIWSYFALLPWTLGPVMGTVTLTLGIAGALQGGFKRATVVTLLFGIALSFGPPGLRWIYDSFIFRDILPRYGFPLIAMPLALMAGDGVHALVQKRHPRRFVYSVLAVALLIAFVAYWLPRTRTLELAPPDWAAKAVVPLQTAFAGHCVLVLGTACLAAIFWKKRPRIAAGIVSTLAMAELAIVVWPYPRVPRSATFTKTPPAVAFVAAEQAKSHGRMVASGMTAFPNTAALYGLADLRIVAAMWVRRQREYFNLIERVGSTFQFVNRPGSPLLDAAAMTTWVEQKRGPKQPANLPGTNYRLAYVGPGAAVYANDSALPRARVVHQAEFVEGEQGALIALRLLQRQGRQALAERVVLEASAEQVPLPGGGPSAAERVEVVSAEDPDEMVLRAHLERDGLVVLADTFYPGWHAYVDGREQPIYAANLAFRGVAVAAGEHAVVFRYKPLALYRGVLVALTALVMCVGLVMQGRGVRHPWNQ